MRKSLNLVVDGVDAKVIRSILESEIGHDEEYGHRSAKVFEAAGAYCPTVGILGAVLGLIHVMENLSDPSKLGGGIAVAFVATVYGVAAANLVFLPIGTKLKLKHRLEIIQHELVMEGVLGIQTGEQPNIIEERLKSLLTELEKKTYKPEKKG
jgi:chemotaxis protein MotA